MSWCLAAMFRAPAGLVDRNAHLQAPPRLARLVELSSAPATRFSVAGDGADRRLAASLGRDPCAWMMRRFHAFRRSDLESAARRQRHRWQDDGCDAVGARRQAQAAGVQAFQPQAQGQAELQAQTAAQARAPADGRAAAAASHLEARRLLRRDICLQTAGTVGEFARTLADGRRTDVDVPADRRRATIESARDRVRTSAAREAERDVDRVQMDELGVRGQVQKLRRLRQPPATAALRSSIAFAIAMTAQIAQASLAWRVGSWSEAGALRGPASTARRAQRRPGAGETAWARSRGNARTTAQTASPAPAARASIRV